MNYDLDAIMVGGKKLGGYKKVPEGTYPCKVVAGDFVKDAQENIGFLWIFQCTGPRKQKGAYIVKMQELKDDKSYLTLMRELTIAGLTYDEQFTGPVAELLPDREVRVSLLRMGKSEKIYLLPPITP
jgi:hypothetical protein